MRRACRLPGGLASVCRTSLLVWRSPVLTVTALTNAEYVLSSVALGIDEYYTGVGEAPGVWAGVWSRAKSAIFQARVRLGSEPLEALFGRVAEPLAGAETWASPR